MININLLPQELKPKKYVLKISNTLKKLVIGSLLIVVFVAVGFSAIFIMTSIQLNSSAKKEAELSREIKNLQTTEQKYYLIKDRLKGVEALNANPNSSDEVILLGKIVDNLPEGISFEAADVNPDYAGVTVLTLNSAGIAKYFATLIGSGYKSINLLSLQYKPNAGYFVEVGVKN